MNDSFNEIIKIRSNNDQNIPKYVQHMPNSFINNFKEVLEGFNENLSPNKQIEPRKPPKIIVGPLIPIDENGKEIEK